ncbi:MAG: YidC/Oxa1 family membrane protein insertase [Patescibacteria group bacterium]
MKDRLLNILLLTFIFLLVINFFLPKPEKQTEKTEPYFHLAKAEYVIPNIPVIDLVNPTDKQITLDTCRDLEVLKDLQKVEIDGSAKDFCKTLTVAAKSQVKMDLNPLRALFEHASDIGFKAKIDGKDITSSVKIAERGSIRVFMATIFYAPVLNLFVYILDALPSHSLGLAIIIITLIVRLILLIPQHHMLVNARKMQEIQPKIKKLQEKYKGDQSKMGMELMELYKKEKVNPLGSCLPLLIQMPILIVLYWVLTSIQDASNHYYFYQFLQGFQVSTITTHFLGMDLLAIGGFVGAGLAILVGAAQWSQIKLSQMRTAGSEPEKKEIIPADPNSIMPDPNMMNAFMLWGMPVMIAVSTYFFPAGVGIYWLIGTLFMLVQQAVANKFSEKK